MKFGKIQDPEKLDTINWALPEVDPTTAPFLSRLHTKPVKLWMGAPAWNHKEWAGKIYPMGTKPADYLSYYSKYFNTIELNTTHYRIPRLDQTQKWLAQVPADFRFYPKIFQGISHEKTGLLDVQLLKFWFEFLQNLGAHLGPSFLQLPPSFDYSHKAILFKFLQQWPQEFPLAIEFRHPSWFENGKIISALTNYLQSREIGLVITDVAGRRDVLHSSISAPFTMIRFVGNSLHPSDFQRAEIWSHRLHEWQKMGLNEVIFFVHQPDDILVPEMTTRLKQISFFAEHSAHIATTSLETLQSKGENLDFFS